MASHTLTSTPEHFPVGTTVKAYLRSARKSGQAPSGVLVTSQAVLSSGSVTFTGLVAGTAYTAYALIGGEHRYRDFSTAPAPSAVEDRVSALETFEFFSFGADVELRDTMAGQTNADPFSFGMAAVVQTDNTTDNFDGGFFAVDVVTAGTTKAHCALQSVTRVNTAGASGWGFNALLTTNQDHTSGYGVWSGEFDVNFNGATDSESIWVGAQNVKGVTSASGGSKRPLLAFGVEKAPGAAPWYYGLRFAYEGGEAAVYDGGADILSQAASGTHSVLLAHIGSQANPRLDLKADGHLHWGPGTGAVDTELYRQGVGALDTATTTLQAWHLYSSNSIEVRGTAGFGYMQLAEQASGVTGVADKARLFARDNGSGKTQLCAQFGTGAVQVVATEP